MIALSTVLSFTHSAAVLPAILVGVVTQSKKILKAMFDLAIYRVEETGRLVRAYRRTADKVRRESRAPRVRGRAPRTPAGKISTEIEDSKVLMMKSARNR
jgi:hypothetical protein